MSWFSEKVGNFVREGPRLGTPAQRTADEMAAELETQARRVNGPQSAAELLSRWVERSDSGQGAFVIGGGSAELAEPLSFHQVILRSQALESLLEACGRVQALRDDLSRNGGNDIDSRPLNQAMRSLAERVLLPGAIVLWPCLMEVLVTSGDDQADRAKPSTELRCGPWARRALSLIKRRWQSEALPGVLRRLDRELARLAARSSKHDGQDSGDNPLRSAGGSGRMSKTGIRAALAKDRLQRSDTEVSRLRTRTELLCDACARLEASQSGSSVMVRKVERLLEDANEMLSALDAGVKEQDAGQECFQASLGEETCSLQKRITEYQETLHCYADKQARLK